MCTVQKLLRLAAGFFILGLISLAPAQSWAQMYTPTGPANNPDCNPIGPTPNAGVNGTNPGASGPIISAMSNGSTIASAKAISNRLYPRGYGPMQTKLAMCIANLEKAYQMITQMFGGPFDPLQIVMLILTMVINQIIMAILTLICAELTMFMNDIQTFAKNAISFINNLVCIPLPKWNANIFGIQNPPATHCAGSPFNGQAGLGGMNATIPAMTPYKFGQ